MKRFSSMRLLESGGLLEVGAGTTWSDVYDHLNGTGIGINGGHIYGVGVSGLTLGGGYSWTTQDHGLMIDTLERVEVVLPSGEIVETSESQEPDLFWAIRGGGNKFGIVTRFTFNSFPQGLVSAGFATYGADGNDTLFPRIDAAIECFTATNNDTKAEPAFSFQLPAGGNPFFLFFWFYNGPITPSGTYRCFDGIPGITAPIVDYLHFSTWVNSTSGRSLDFINFLVEPYASHFMTVSTKYDRGGAFPHSTLALPSKVQFSWTSTSDDAYFQKQLLASSARLTALAEKTGITSEDLPAYMNYANYATPIRKIYQSNLTRLRKLQKRYDPAGIMTLAGGWVLE
ncbi:FAD-binding domain-containing protein [Pseudohyphozyma bogoriensis]|nr:FAD-binding domain-containing protein [Pseudohyphozyma bogoriensis]